MVIRTGGVYCLLHLRRVAADIYPLFHKHVFFNVSLVGIQFTYNRPSETFFLFPGALKCWCGTIATMFWQAPGRDSPDLYCFPSWLYLLDGEDNCMLFVPFCTSDLHYDSWQSGEKFTGGGRRAFTLLCYAFWFSSKGCSSPCFSMFFCCLAHALSARCFPSFRPDTAFQERMSVVATGIP